MTCPHGNENVEKCGACVFNQPSRAAVERAVARGHHCHAKRCKVAVPPELLMCRKHWRMVPQALRRAVWDAYRPGQCELSPLPSKVWHEAADAAIAHVATLEGVQ